MRKFSKIILRTLLAVCLLVSVFALNLNVSAATDTNENLEIKGAQIRTEDPAGIRFVASYTGEEEVKAYGVVLAWGKAEASEITLDATVNGKTTLYGAVEEQNENGVYHVTLVNVPEVSYVQEVTARAFIVKNDNSVEYSEQAVTRSLAQVSLLYANDNEVAEGSAVEAVVNYVKENYKKAYTHSVTGYYVVDDATVETDPAKLEAEFVKDWNAKFGTEWTSLVQTEFQKSAASAGTNGAALADTLATDCSGTKMYEFFNSDTTTSAKWQWLLQYFLAKCNTVVHPKRQINAVLGDGTASDTYGSNMNSFNHLSASIVNFFNGGNTRNDSNDIVFTSAKYSTYSSVIDYSKIYANVSNVELVKVGEKVKLPAATTPATGYEWDGWYEGTTKYEAESTYTVTSSNVVFVPTHKAIEYTITYMDGDTSLSDLTPNVYTIESNNLSLPTPIKEGSVFLGWHEDKQLKDASITAIMAGTTGNKTYYCEWGTSFVATNTTSNSKYSTISDAVKNAAQGDVIVIEPGTYSEDIDITTGITLTSSNKDVNPTENEEQFLGDEAVVLTGKLTIHSQKISEEDKSNQVKNLTICGLTFTKNARVFVYGDSTNFTGFVFKNNYCYDLTYTAKSWSETGTVGYSNSTTARSGFLNVGGSYGWVVGAQYINNVFKNINDSAIELQCTQGVTFQGNLFETIKYDAIRNNYSNSYENYLLDNNVFKNIGYSAFYIRKYGSGNAQTFTIINNEFNNVAYNSSNSGATGYVVGAISSAFYGESKAATWIIKYNKFINTPHSINLRDNVSDSSKWPSKNINWSCEVTYNAFINETTPDKYQENWKPSGDSAATNTGNFLFDYNYYGTSESQSIDLNDSLFTQISSDSNKNVYTDYNEYLAGVAASKGNN